MAFRGGRGGGRGRGRGRFGARGIGLPVARDESGSIMVAEKLDGPPPVFPPQKLPEVPDSRKVSKTETYIIVKKRALEAAWHASPYYFEEPKGKVVADIQRYSDRYKPELKRRRAPLSIFLKLAPAFFPTELLGQDRRRRQSTKAAATSQWLLDPGVQTGKRDRFDQLLSLEEKAKTHDDGGKEPGEKQKEGEEEGGGDDEEVVDEEDDFEDDDYAQMHGFDDDEDYNVDIDEGGDDEGAVY